MKKLVCIAALTFGLAACGGSKSSNNTQPEPPAPPAQPDRFVSLRTAIEQNLADNNAAAVSVGIYENGNIVFAEAFGETVRGNGVAPTANTLFQMGSTTKMFTGLATLQLVEQGVLTIDDTLVTTLPGMPYPAEDALSWEGVNIQHLLTHQSGFLDAYPDSTSTAPLVEYMVGEFPQQNTQMNPPGRFHNYSNPNWSYLGAIVERLSQQPYADYMKQQVFTPLDMARTTMTRSEVIADGDFAIGYQESDTSGYINNVNQIEPSLTGLPAGSETWSTPTEVLKMAEFLLNGDSDVLPDQLRTEITKSQVSAEFAGLPMGYGYGIFVDDGFMYNDQWVAEKVWQHGGNTLAFTHIFWILPEKNIAVSIMSSGAYNDFLPSMVAALNAVTDLPAAQATPYAPSNPSEYGKHEGVYNYDLFTMIVSQEGNNLTISIPEMDAINTPYERELFPIGGDTFFSEIDGQGNVLTFLPEGDSDESVYIRSRAAVGIKEGY